MYLTIWRTHLPYILRHIHMVHLSERPHICLTCGKAFKQKAHLEKHVSSVHEKRRPSVCPVPGCNAAFRENYNLKQVCIWLSLDVKAIFYVCSTCSGTHCPFSPLFVPSLIVHSINAPSTTWMFEAWFQFMLRRSYKCIGRAKTPFLTFKLCARRC